MAQGNLIVGIVAEYNPFHKGHLYQIEQAKKLSGADTVVAVMSGSFVQRGDAAICNKWARAKMALLNGVDLVIELPVTSAVQSAEFFARGAVSLLHALNADRISFGAETDDLSALKTAANIIDSQPEEYKTALDTALKSGVSFPRARDIALAELGEYGEVLRSPNNILGVEYIRAGAKNPLPIKRIGSDHDSSVSSDGYASASYIRELLLKGDYAQAGEFMPPGAFDLLMDEIANGCAPVSMHNLENTIIANLRKELPARLAQTPDVTEGLENRIIDMAKKECTLSGLVDAVKSKRYTHARLRRIMINYLLGITTDTQGCPCEYIRVLGGNKKGLALLNDAHLPVITKPALHKEAIRLELVASDLYSLLYENPACRHAGQDFLNSPIIIQA